jgi:hypothetical protein
MTLNMALPYLTAFDPPGAGEGSLDPLGLYQIADQMAVGLVPAVRERMIRIRLLSAITVGALVTEGLEEGSRSLNASPQLVWEWLVVEALVRRRSTEGELFGVPGSVVARRALRDRGYLDASGYLKTPRVFGFHGVYKRLTSFLGLTDTHLSPGPAAERLVDAWARGVGMGGIEGARPTLRAWAAGIRRSLRENPPRTNPGWSAGSWETLAAAFTPSPIPLRERRVIRELLLSRTPPSLGALPDIWEIQEEHPDASTSEEALHKRLQAKNPAYRPLLRAVAAYEEFARSLQDAFDLLRAEAGSGRSHDYLVPHIAGDKDFARSVEGLHGRFERAYRALAEAGPEGLTWAGLFQDRFRPFAEPVESAACAMALCAHHEAIQRGKSDEGKRPWFDRTGSDRIFIRHGYRIPRPEIQPKRYVHPYRGAPVRRFRADLA